MRVKRVETEATNDSRISDFSSFFGSIHSPATICMLRCVSRTTYAKSAACCLSWWIISLQQSYYPRPKKVCQGISSGKTPLVAVYLWAMGFIQCCCGHTSIKVLHWNSLRSPPGAGTQCSGHPCSKETVNRSALEATGTQPQELALSRNRLTWASISSSYLLEIGLCDVVVGFCPLTMCLCRC